MASQLTSQENKLPQVWQNFFHETNLEPIPSQKEAFGFLLREGLPNRNVEEWRYTSLKSLSEPAHLSRGKMELDVKAATASTQERRIRKSENPTEFSQVLQKWNSIFANSKRKKRRVLAQPQELTPFRDGTDALHEAFVEEIVSIESKSPSDKLSLVWRDDESSAKEAAQFPRIMIEVKPGHKLTLTTRFSSPATHIHAKFQVLLHEGALLDWVHIQDNSKNVIDIDQIEIHAESRSKGHCIFVGSGSQMSRQNVRLTFSGQEAQFKLHGICLGQGDQHFDSSTIIEHLKGGNNSEQIFKSVLGDRAKSIFSGLVYIEKQAQLANSHQLNKSLILNRGAEAVSQPQLEIYADDVKATHGSTVGQIQPEEIFYLKSRAISESEAVALLCEGFAAELVYELEDEEQKVETLNFIKQRVRSFRK